MLVAEIVQLQELEDRRQEMLDNVTNADIGQCRQFQDSFDSDLMLDRWMP